MDQQLADKYSKLKQIISQAGSALVAFSGGVDSTFLLKVCVDVLGDKALAVVGESETFPTRELNEAIALAENMGARLIKTETRELHVPGFSQNPPNRCFLCKSELFTILNKIAAQEGISNVFDGSNADDVGDYRPGREAACELGVTSPLEEAGMTKDDIRAISKELDLPTWDKPSFACLSSRYPYNSEITEMSLKQIEQAEDFLWSLGLREFRVRHHEDLARIELGKKELESFWAEGNANKISARFKELGYKFVTLDLEGYRTGKMNLTLPGIK